MIYREEHVKQLQALAKPGADELFYLGECHYFGEGGVEGNYPKAFQLFQQAVALDPSNGKAFYWLAQCYEWGYARGRDEALASRLYTQAFLLLKQQSEAVPNDAHAQFVLALWYWRRDCVTRDSATAVVWYKQAAMQGHAAAQDLLGRCLSHGWGVAIDKVEGACWLAQAARQGICSAKGALSWLLYQNDGLLKELTNRANKNRNDFLAYARGNLVLLFQDADSVLDELMKRAKTNRNDYLAASALAYINDKGVVLAAEDQSVVVAANAERASHWKQRAEQCSESIPAEWLPSCLRVRYHVHKAGSPCSTLQLPHSLSRPEKLKENALASRLLLLFLLVALLLWLLLFHRDVSGEL